MDSHGGASWNPTIRKTPGRPFIVAPPVPCASPLRMRGVALETAMAGTVKGSRGAADWRLHQRHGAGRWQRVASMPSATPIEGSELTAEAARSAAVLGAFRLVA